MTGETPRPPRKKSPETLCVDTVLVRFTVQAHPVDAESQSRDRKGRPERFPSVPPQPPKPAE